MLSYAVRTTQAPTTSCTEILEPFPVKSFVQGEPAPSFPPVVERIRLYLEQSHSQRVEWWVPGAREKGQIFQLGKTEKFWRWTVVTVAQQSECTLAPLSWILKSGSNGKLYVTWFFTTIKIKKKKRKEGYCLNLNSGH